MGYLKAQETDVLKMPSNSDYWVRFRVRAPWGVKLNAQGNMMKVTAKAGPEGETNGHANGGSPKVEVVSEAEWASYIRTLVLGFIVEWNLTDSDDKPLPISAESLSLIDDQDGQFLASEAQARSKLRSQEDERNLGSNSRRRSSTIKR